MKKNQKNIRWVSFVLFFSITKISFDFCIIEPISNYDDYFNKTSPKQYEIIPNNDLNNSNDMNKIDDFHYYFDDVFGETVDAMPSYPQTDYMQYLSDSETGLNYLVIKLGGDWRNCLDPAAVE